MQKRKNSGWGLVLGRKQFHQLRIDPSSRGIGDGGELDGVVVVVNQLGVTMTNKLISRDQIQLVELNRQLASTQ